MKGDMGIKGEKGEPAQGYNSFGGLLKILNDKNCVMTDCFFLRWRSELPKTNFGNSDVPKHRLDDQSKFKPLVNRHRFS